MRNWRTEKALYEIKEIGKGINSTYPIIATGEEISKKLKAKNEMNGYIPGLGGDKTYSATAVLLSYDI